MVVSTWGVIIVEEVIVCYYCLLDDNSNVIGNLATRIDYKPFMELIMVQRPFCILGSIATSACFIKGGYIVGGVDSWIKVALYGSCINSRWLSSLWNSVDTHLSLSPHLHLYNTLCDLCNCTSTRFATPSTLRMGNNLQLYTLSINSMYAA